MGKIGSLVKDTMLSFASNTFSYAINTTIQVLEQISVYKDAIHHVLNDKKSRLVLYHMNFILWDDVIPMITLNALNNKLQQTFQNDEQTEFSCLDFYSYFAALLMLINYTVVFITWRQGIQTTIRVAALETFAPPAFLSSLLDKMELKCDTRECHIGVQLQGNIKQLVNLFANDTLASSVRYIPVVGPAASTALSIIFKGRFIVRSVTPGLCAEHKLPSFRLETIIALGLIYQLYCWSLEEALSKTIGLPPYLYLRSLQHLILLLQVPFAAQRILTMTKSNTKPEGNNIIDIYEYAVGFLVETLIAGVPVVLNGRKSQKPFITVHDVLQVITKLIEADAYHQKSLPPIVISRVSQAWNWNSKHWTIFWYELFPPVMQGTQGFIRDPIIAAYWPGFKSRVLYVVTTLKIIRAKTQTSNLMQMTPTHFLMLAVYFYFGVPKKLTESALKCIEDQYFWDFISVLENWVEVHDSSNQIQEAQEEVLLLVKPEKSLININESQGSIDRSNVVQCIDLDDKDKCSAKEVTRINLFAESNRKAGNTVISLPLQDDSKKKNGANRIDLSENTSNNVKDKKNRISFN